LAFRGLNMAAERSSEVAFALPEPCREVCKQRVFGCSWAGWDVPGSNSTPRLGMSRLFRRLSLAELRVAPVKDVRGYGGALAV